MIYQGWIAFVAGSITGNGSKIYSPFGTKPNYTDMQQSTGAISSPVASTIPLFRAAATPSLA